MDHELIISILQKSYCLKNEIDAQEAKEFLDKLKNSHNLLLNKLVVQKLVDILSEILMKCTELSATSTEAQLETQIVDSLHSWCLLSNIPNHEIYTPETLKVLLEELTNQFQETNLNADDLILFRQFVKYNLPERNSDSIESIYSKKLQFKQKLQLRKKVQLEMNKKNDRSPLVPSKTFNEIQNTPLPLANKEVVAYNTTENIDVKKIMNLLAALKSLSGNSEVTVKIGKLLKNVTNFIFVHLSDMNDLKPYYHIFYEDYYDVHRSSMDNNQELLFLENVSQTFIENMILEEIFQAISKIVLQNTEYNYSEIIILINNFDLNCYSKLKKMFDFCSKSQQLFTTVTSILNELLIKANYDMRIIIIIQSFLKEINFHQRIRLYPEKYRDLIFHLDLYPETLSALHIENQILEKIFELYLESPRICLMILSHYPAWISYFSAFFNNLCQ